MQHFRVRGLKFEIAVGSVVVGPCLGRHHLKAAVEDVARSVGKVPLPKFDWLWHLHFVRSFGCIKVDVGGPKDVNRGGLCALIQRTNSTAFLKHFYGPISHFCVYALQPFPRIAVFKRSCRSVFFNSIPTPWRISRERRRVPPRGKCSATTAMSPFKYSPFWLEFRYFPALNWPSEQLRDYVSIQKVRQQSGPGTWLQYY